jgi:two-component system, OmpR family, KDP operon response regulator KdpE
MKPRVLIVDDEPQIQRFLHTILEVHQYDVAPAATAAAALEHVASWRPDLLLLDLGLPEVSGLEVIRRVREWSDVPIIVLSVRDREEDKVAALNLGADDYVTKPFGTNELLARIQVALRHAARIHLPQEPVITVGDLRLDLTAHRVFLRDQEVHLTPTEYDILKTLAIYRGRVLTHGILMHKVWGIDQQQDAAKLRVFINQIRRKIEEDTAQPRYIVTEPGIGYRFGGETDN